MAITIVQQSRNIALVYQNIKPLFFSGSASYKPGHYFCLAVLGFSWHKICPLGLLEIL